MKCFEQSKVVDAILLGTEITEKDRRVFNFDKDSIFATEFPLDTRNGFIEIEGY